MIHLQMGDDVEGSGRQLTCIVLAFAWKDLGKP
jgi:hypothetical protein